MKKIFFSYTLKDDEINKNFLHKIKEWLNKQNVDSYIDLIDNIYDADLFQTKLIDELKRCDILFIIDTKKYNESQWADIEIEEAKKRNLLVLKAHYSVIQNAIKNNYSINYFVKQEFCLSSNQVLGAPQIK